MTSYSETVKKSLLLIDDNTERQLQVQRGFGDTYEIFAVSHIADIEDLAEISPDAVLVNLEVVGESAVHLLGKVKEQANFHEVPVYFLSPGENPLQEEAMINMGAADYLPMTVPMPVLKARVGAGIALRNRLRHLYKVSMVDSVSRLPSRQRFREQLEREWGRAIRAQKSVTLIALELQGLYKLADMYGEPVYNRCFAQVARAIEQCLQRPGDFPARYLGDKIMVILPDTDQKGAALVCQRLWAAAGVAVEKALDHGAMSKPALFVGYHAEKPRRGASLRAFIQTALDNLSQDRESVDETMARKIAAM